jgi:pimeloyl-ACP methyl ester carboxylesterase
VTAAAIPMPKGWSGLRARTAVLLAAIAVLAATLTFVPAASAARLDKVPQLVWLGCGGGFDCATAQVPVDYSQPTGAMISLALIRLPATDPDHRIGSLFVNPGGPGGSGVDLVRAAASILWTPEVRARFDIVGFDPRGVAGSAPIQCFASNAAEYRLIGPLPRFPVGTEQQATYISTYEQFDDICLQRNASIMQHMATADVARDLDLLRQAVGDPALTYDGVSYGSYLGTTYANMFPGKVRALIVDGVINPIEWATGTGGDSTLPFTTRVNGARGAYETLLQFFILCRQVGNQCAFSDGDPKSRYYALLDRARRHPIIEPGQPPVTFADIVSMTLGALYDPGSWPSLARALQQLDLNSNSPAAAAAIRLLVARIVGDPSTSYINAIEAYYSVACSDTNNPSDPLMWPPAAANQDAHFPYFGSAWTWQSEPCSTWPSRDSARYTGPWNHATSAPVLVVGNLYDPATPYQGAQAVAVMLPGARLLTLAGWGHIALGKSRCIDAYVTNYLVSQVLPPPGSTCQPNTTPFSQSAESTATPPLAAIPWLVPALIPRDLHLR